MIHFRGLPVGYTADFTPLCSSRAESVSGPMTTSTGEVTCETCRKVLKLTARQWTPPKPGAASRELLAGKHWTEPTERDDSFADGDYDARSGT